MSWGWIALSAALLGGAGLRAVGFTRGEVQLGTPSPVEKATSFYHFHPDEATLLRASQELGDPLSPPLTAYGMLPLYLARAATGAAGWLAGARLDLDDPAGWKRAVLAGRALALALSLATLVALGAWGWRSWDGATAALAVALAAAAPLAVQQAHFYTVDGPFCLLALLSLQAVLAADRRPTAGRYALAGTLIGLTAAVRVNGLIGAALLAGVHLACPAQQAGSGVLRRLLDRRLWIAGAAAGAVLLALEPYLLLRPELMTHSANTDDFAYSLAVARGDLLRPWSLADAHTVPYLHFWTHLWPQSCGWPLTLLLAAGLAWGLVRGGRQERLIAAWCLLYFLGVGGLHTKHVRYLLPLLAPLCLLAAGLVSAGLRDGRPGRRRLAIAAFAGAAAWTWLYGVAFAGIYREEDARLTAGRWIASHVPAGKAVSTESGAFSMRGYLHGGPFAQHELNTVTVFATRGYLSCRAAALYLASLLESVDYVTVTDVNRYRQFTAAPDLCPVAASFYDELFSGRLGFQTLARFKVYPAFAGVTFQDDGAEPSFLGYDHPAALVLGRTEAAAPQLERWQQRAESLEGCADGDLAAAVTALQAGDADRAYPALERSAETAPGLAAFLEAHTREEHARAAGGYGDGHTRAMDAFMRGFRDLSLSPFLLPWATATSLVALGRPTEALAALHFGWQQRDGFPREVREGMARSYMYVAAQLDEATLAGGPDAFAMATDLWESPFTLNAAAQRLQDRGDDANAAAMWERSLQLQEDQVEVHRALGRAAQKRGDGAAAIPHLRRAVELDPDLDGGQKAQDYASLARAAQAVGQTAQAAQLWASCLEAGPSRPDLALAAARELAALGDPVAAAAQLRRLALAHPEWAADLSGEVARLEPGR